MMMNNETGGPAFPVPGHENHFGETINLQHGMTLRDYFAAKAMQGLIASDDEGAGDRIEDIPGYAYMIADAMLAQRTK
jgi:hypothetical protein